MSNFAEQSRSVESVIPGRATSDGAGVKLTRLFERSLQKRLDPFLMLDAFGSDSPDDYIAGFPDHPHRGFETITYMLAGRMLHRDSAGHEGLLESGGVQWMTTGKGVVHSEIPQQSEGRMAGFQLWLNLPAADKLCAPWYHDFPASELPRGEDAQGCRWTVIAGSSHGVEGAVQRPQTEPLIVDLELPAGASFWQDLPASHHAFVVPYTGEVEIGGRNIPAQHLAILHDAGTGVTIQAHTASRVLLVAGRPLGEPIAQYGPFVMNNEEQLQQALEDYRAGRLA
ncbi:pirin family protein [Acidithiobacillus sp. IBUN Pt1247-S3]|uniref:pirin family protein n=1 Tax=Acidithiobacillus sp. IBUN Pt1247-S3 TaxID=3166642 RepID=UPI0034E49226